MVQVDTKKLRGPSILYKKEDVKKQGQPSIYRSGWKIEDQGSIIDQKGASRLFILPLHSTKLLSPSEKNAAKKNAEIAAHSKLVRESGIPTAAAALAKALTDYSITPNIEYVTVRMANYTKPVNFSHELAERGGIDRTRPRFYMACSHFSR